MTTINTNMHFHRYDRMGQILAKGGLSLAIQQDGNSVVIAYARCSNEENFRRSLGRAVAQGRLQKYMRVKPVLDLGDPSLGDQKNIIRATIPEAVALKSFVVELPEVRRATSFWLVADK